MDTFIYMTVCNSYKILILPHSAAVWNICQENMGGGRWMNHPLSSLIYNGGALVQSSEAPSSQANSKAAEEQASC